MKGETQKGTLRLGWLIAVATAAMLFGFSSPAKAEPPGPTVGVLRVVPRRPPSSLSIPTLDFRDFYKFGARAPEPTPELLALDGKQVTLVGFMVLLESPVLGGFYLSPYPASSDESGAGRGGLPPTSVLVLPTVARGKYVAFVPGALEVVGTLEVLNKETSGETATIRLVVDDVRKLKFARTRSTLKAPRSSALQATKAKKRTAK